MYNCTNLKKCSESHKNGGIEFKAQDTFKCFWEIVWCNVKLWLSVGCRLGGRCDIKLPLPLFRDTEGALSHHNGTERPVCVCVCVCVSVCVGGVVLAATPRLIGHTSQWNPLKLGHMSACNTPPQLRVSVCSPRTKHTKQKSKRKHLLVSLQESPVIVSLLGWPGFFFTASFSTGFRIKKERKSEAMFILNHRHA